MHRSGITVSDELKHIFAEAGKNGFSFLKVQITDERFVVAQSGAGGGSLAQSLAASRAVLDDRVPCYAITRADEPDKWVLVMYVPDTAQVKDKMLYASSRNALKDGLGGAHFLHDLFISKKDECSYENYTRSQRSDEVDKSVMTMDEVIKREAQEDSMLAMSIGKVKVTAIADMPVSVSPEAESAIRGFAEGKVVAASFYLDPTETLRGKPEQSASVEYLSSLLSQQGKDPCYLLFSYTHEFEAKQSSPNVFALYCNDSAPPRNKMMYSSCKSYVLKIFEELGVKVDKKVQVNDPPELNSEFLFEELHPRVVNRSTFAKPKIPGKGKARMFDAPKFDHQS